LRALDVLNDISTDYLQLHDVAVRRGIHGDLVQQLSSATIPKSAVDFVLLEADQHEAPLRRTHAFVAKQPLTALILSDDYELQGTSTFKGSADAIRTLRQEKTAFFPVTTANLTRVNGTEPQIFAAVVFVNCLKISLLNLDRFAASSTTLANPKCRPWQQQVADSEVDGEAETHDGASLFTLDGQVEPLRVDGQVQ
jgi:hypothetical protein